MKDYSNYHNIDSNNKMLNDGNLLFERGLDGFNSEDCTINGVTTKALITSKFSSSNGTEKRIIGRVTELEQGYLVEYNDEKWLIVSKPENNKIYKKANIKFCNHTISLQGEVTKELAGYDSYGRPIYREVEGTLIPVPCIIETTFYRADESQQPINLPEGKVRCTIPFTTHKDLILGGEITLWDDRYKITGIDKSQSLNNTGLMILHAELVVN